MNVLFVASEVDPFAKTGGLGDVAAALPRALANRGHNVRIVMPMYGRMRNTENCTHVFDELHVELGSFRIQFSVLSTQLPGSRVPVYFIRCPALYDRPSIYTQDADEHLRFALLNWASLVLCQHLRFRPDVVHANDWQTSLIPLLLRTRFAWDSLFSDTRTVLTIHNLAHQGTFDARVLADLGLGDEASYFHQDELREGRLRFLLTGILYANAITTVSPTYAREIQLPEHGVGLDAFLRERRNVLFGILNGIDAIDWNPELDHRIEQSYSAATIERKELNKKGLLDEAGLPYAETVPVIGIVSRLVFQKGFDLCFKVLPRLLASRPIQLVVLGTGESKYETFFHDLHQHFPRQVAYLRAFNERIAHRIEAGADMFLMPSLYEPCGLNQMYSLRYGTPPIVHKTGGLADTVLPFDRFRRDGTGFVFEHFDEEGLSYALRTALDAWGNGAGEDRASWRALQRRGMRGDFGWDHRIHEYERVYERVAPGR